MKNFVSLFLSLFLIATGHVFAAPSESIVLKNDAGVELSLENTGNGWYINTISHHGQAVGKPLEGMIYVRNIRTGRGLPLKADKVNQLDEQSAELSGQTELYHSLFSFQYKIVLDKKLPVIHLTPSWKVNKDLYGWEIGTHFCNLPANHDWRIQSYPFAGNSERVDINPMRYCGIPGALIYTPNLSTVLFFTIDSRSDYLNPTSWTGDTRFCFDNKNQPPVFFHCGGKISASVDYEMPLQLYLDDTGKFETSITNIVRNWMKATDYKVEPLHVRTPQEFYDITLASRPHNAHWIEGKGYEHHRGTPFIYVGNNPYIAYMEYLLYKKTGNKLWRDRAFAQIDFAIKGQMSNGCFYTSYNIKDRGTYGGKKDQFVNWCWSHGGCKVDINAWSARYILQTWQAVKEHENLDQKEWYEAAIKSSDWVLQQQNPDGGFPQCVHDEAQIGKMWYDFACPKGKSESVVSGRLMDALPKISTITGNDIYLKKALEAEKFMREKVENRFWYTGMHPDLPPLDFEQDSVYAVVEYWLDKYDRTNDKDALDHAVANAHFALLCYCPKQLSWCKKPTQGAHTEQQNFNQYSSHCYGNRKIQCLDRLYKATNDPFYQQLQERLMQMFFSTQLTEGEYKGSVYEAVCDPWLERGVDFEFSREPYTSELVSDMMIMLIELGWVK
ncbi:hypothetical protein FACS189454_01770 [Planctomycetales bacterium]|nr:hypothetical protein FACS189454_01770 [Planctomycetales bacterium]